MHGPGVSSALLTSFSIVRGCVGHVQLNIIRFQLHPRRNPPARSILFAKHRLPAVCNLIHPQQLAKAYPLCLSSRFSFSFTSFNSHCHPLSRGDQDVSTGWVSFSVCVCVELLLLHYGSLSSGCCQLQCHWRLTGEEFTTCHLPASVYECVCGALFMCFCSCQNLSLPLPQPHHVRAYNPIGRGRSRSRARADVGVKFNYTTFMVGFTALRTR